MTQTTTEYDGRVRAGRTTITEISQLPLLLSVPVMAATGAASSPQLRKMCREGTLPATKVGTDWRVSKGVFCEFFNLY